jgi:hypothetical protein
LKDKFQRAKGQRKKAKGRKEHKEEEEIRRKKSQKIGIGRDEKNVKLKIMNARHP